ncbi:SNARE associated Golgi protein family [Tasmannia lanceolata]|uniref:SNARE associated Golgi protein family n=1 Tax=Tasmannia lanceolata TaxID=3420 RepID=UPI004062BD07
MNGEPRDLAPSKEADLQESPQRSLIQGLHDKHRLDLENLTLTTQPFKTFNLFTLATLQYLKQSILYVLRKGSHVMLLGIVVLVSGFLLMVIDGPHEKHVQEFLRYFRFVLWWVALGVASSIGLGSGLHTFLLYLGPHIALFTIKAMQCGRVDLKTAAYDTIQLNSSPSWLKKDCSAYGPPLFQSLPGSMVSVPLSSILPQVQLEAILWGIGTALGELPPYFISRAGSKSDAVELDAPSKEDGVIRRRLKQIKRWFFRRKQHLNFFTILVLASVPNPLFDLAGIMCGQFGISFWKFFLATLTGKAIIKAHIQTVFIITVCNNQLLEWTENELIWVLRLIPGLSSIQPNLTAKLYKMKDKYLTTTVPAPPSIKGDHWDLSVSSIWNTIIWLVVINFFVKIVTSTAQRFLKKQQELELAALNNKLSAASQSNAGADHISN